MLAFMSTPVGVARCRVAGRSGPRSAPNSARIKVRQPPASCARAPRGHATSPTDPAIASHPRSARWFSALIGRLAGRINLNPVTADANAVPPRAGGTSGDRGQRVLHEQLVDPTHARSALGAESAEQSSPGRRYPPGRANPRSRSPRSRASVVSAEIRAPVAVVAAAGRPGRSPLRGAPATRALNSADRVDSSSRSIRTPLSGGQYGLATGLDLSGDHRPR